MGLCELDSGEVTRLPDATGRQTPQVIDGSSFTLSADLAIKALGFDPEDLPTLFGEPELQVSRWGTIRIDWRTMMTTMPGVFAGGDIVALGTSDHFVGDQLGRQGHPGASQLRAHDLRPRVAADQQRSAAGQPIDKADC